MNTVRVHDALVVTPELLERFWSKVRVDESGCWIWTAAKRGRMNPYGAFGVNKTVQSAHVVSWCIANDEPRVPVGFLVTHECDNKACVNPRHLKLGTNASNMQDARDRGIGKGPGCEWRKLTESGVRDIRRRYESGEATIDELAVEFHVGPTAILRVVNRKTWRHVG